LGASQTEERLRGLPSTSVKNGYSFGNLPPTSEKFLSPLVAGGAMPLCFLAPRNV